MMDKKLRYYLPLGIEPASELRWLAGGLTGCFLSSLIFFVRYFGHYNNLFETVGKDRVIIKGATMPHFAYIAPDCFSLFVSFSAAMVFLSIYHYYYHYMGSKSIYTMKRLPSAWDLWRRCLTFPFIAGVVSLIIAFILLMLYFAFYMLVTPDICIMPGQFENLINVISGGVF